MNAQIRKIFVVVLIMFAMLGLAITNTQFISAPSLNADPRNVRTTRHAAEVDRGPIIVEKTAIASSELEEDSNRYTRVYDEGPLYVSATGYFSAIGYGATGIEEAEADVLDGQSQTLLGQRLRNLLTGEKRQGGGASDAERLHAAGSSHRARRPQGCRCGAGRQDRRDPRPLLLPDLRPEHAGFQRRGQSERRLRGAGSDPKKPMLNRAISERYAPGSTFKVITVIALIENGIANPDTHMASPVTTTLPGTVTQVSNIESSTCGDGNPTLTEAFARSCNTTFVLASQQLTNQQLTDITNRFGLIMNSKSR